MAIHTRPPLLLVSAMALSLNSCAGFNNEQLQGIVQAGSQVLGGNQGFNQALSNSEMVTGFKEALASGVETAINQLGRSDGFLGNALVRIEPPETLAKVARGLETIGQGQVVDDFRTSLNRAAEQAVPEVSSIFGNTIRAITFEDVQSLLNGGDRAITQFFEAKPPRL